MRASHVLLAVSVLAAGCDRAAPPETSALAAASADQAQNLETARLTDWLDARYEEELAFSPLEKTALGRKDDYDKIDDLSEAGEEAQLEWRRGTVRDLERNFDRSGLTREGQTSYDLWRYALEQAEAAEPFRRRFYMFHQMGGPHTDLPQALINFHRVDDEADMVAYVTRIGEVGRATRSGSRARAARGRRRRTRAAVRL